MDPERQPLLAPTASQLALRKSRKLNYEEVLCYHSTGPWRRARLCLLFVFWASMALLLSVIVSMLLQHHCAADLGPAPTVPPVHMSFLPLMH